jgi:hypothetical protein
MTLDPERVAGFVGDIRHARGSFASPRCRKRTSLPIRTVKTLPARDCSPRSRLRWVSATTCAPNRFRNRLVHLYWDTDFRLVRRIVRDELDDLEAFAEAVEGLV